MSDKLQHLLAGAIISAAYTPLSLALPSRWSAYLIATSVSVVAAIVKEFTDYQHIGIFDLKDAAFTVLGGAAISLLVFLI